MLVAYNADGKKKKKKTVRFVINVSFFCSVNIQQTATKGVNFRLFGADLSFFGM